MTAVFQIEQSSSTPGPGIARQDIVPDVVVNFEAMDSGSHSTFEWEVISAARDAVYTSLTSPPGEPHKASCTFTTRGGYLVRLIVDKETSTEDVSVLYVGLPLENSGLAIPALAETNQDTSQSPHSGWFGAYEKVDSFFKWIDANVGAGGSSFFEVGVGDDSLLRSGIGAAADGDSALAFGEGSNAYSQYSVAFGQECLTTWDGEIAQSLGLFGTTSPGRGMASRAVLGGETFTVPNDSVELVDSPTGSGRIWTRADYAYSCVFNIVAKHAAQYSAGNLMAVAWRGEFLVVADHTGDPQLIGLNINRYAETAFGNEADWDIAITVDAVDNKIQITGTADSGSASKSVRWFGSLDVSQVNAYDPT